MQHIIKQAANSSFEDDAIVLYKAARIIREDILNSNVKKSLIALLVQTASNNQFRQMSNTFC